MSTIKVPVVGSGINYEGSDNQGVTPTTGAEGGGQPATSVQGEYQRPQTPAQQFKPQPRYQQQIARQNGRASLHDFHLQPGAQPADGQVEDGGQRNSFHPDLDPEKFDFSFDRFGRLLKTPKAAPVATAETVEEAPAEDVPDAAAAVAAAQSTLAGQPTPGMNDMDALRQHVSQLTQVVLGMAQLQNGQGAQPAQSAQPEAPDYSNIDMYDPAQVVALSERAAEARFNKLMKEQFQPQVSRIDEQNAQSQVNHIISTYGRAAVEQRAELLMELAKSNPTSNVIQLWDLADRLVGQVTTTTKPAVTQPLTQATRTITASQAAEKVEQAKRLPSKAASSNSGVTGASTRSGPPERMLKNLALGSIAAWNSVQNGR
jgi:predicted RNA-binding Zn ribbon-like protein